MPVVSIARGSAEIFTCVAVSGTCLTATRIFTRPLLVMELPRDAEAVAGDEDAIEDDRRAGRIEGDALGLERGRPDRAPELARLAPSETHRGDRLVRAPDDDPERALERLVERRAGEVR